MGLRAALVATVLGLGLTAGLAVAVRSEPPPVVSPRPHPAPVAAVAAPGGQAMGLATPDVRATDQVLGPIGLPVPSGATVGAPARLRIPALGLDAALGQVGLNGDGTIQVPGDWNQPAWYSGGPQPGAQGPAVIVGHLDSYTGPAVFWRLGQLQAGDAISVVRADGSAVTFRVRSVAAYERQSFPTAQVYGATPVPALRLITCAGKFDWTGRHYSQNVVVFAELA
ncbi:MAG: class F sortase [Candidatus Dormibacteraeota bacterium]|nr:class F sortase [Candidatus Dormibacteraeota bacterium]